MKLSVVVLLACFLFACNKQNEYRKRFAGTWELRQVSGYPFTYPELPPGNGNIIVLHDDGSFEKRKSDTVVFRGSYSIDKKKDCQSRPDQLFFSTNDSASSDAGRYIDLENKELTLSTSNCLADGGTLYYRSIQ